MDNPTTTHWAAVKRILQYLKGVVDHGLFFQLGTFQSQAYSDADWAEGPDDRRSTTGLCIYLGPNVISWSFKKQATVSHSSIESEYRSLAITAAEISQVQKL